MPPEATPAPVAPPAAAAPTPPPVPPTPPAAPPAERTSKDMAKNLFNLLTAPTADPAEPAKEKKETAPPPPVAPKKTDTPAPKLDDKPIKRSKTEATAPTEEKRPELPKKKADDAPPPSPAPAAAATTKVDDEAFEKGLPEEERVLLDDARSAEKFIADKYKGHGGKMLAFLRENAKKAEAVEKGDLDQADYEKWHAANLPKVSVLDQRRVSEERVRESVRKDYEPKLEEERHARWADAEGPKIKAKGNDVYNKLSNTALPDDVMAAIAERTKGITDRAEYVKKVQEVQKDFALEFEVAESVINQATSDIETFHALTTVNPATKKPVLAFDENNAQHNAIVGMVGQLCADFKATGGAALKNDKGQWFATREEWQDMKSMVDKGQLAADELKKWWTFSNEQIVERAQAKVKDVVKNGIAQRLDYLKGRGFTRVIAPSTAPAVPTPPVPPSSGAPAAPRPATPPPPGAPPLPSIGTSLAGKLTSQPAAQ